MAREFSPEKGQAHVQQEDGTIIFPDSRHQFVYHPSDTPGWYYVPQFQEERYQVWAGPCALCGHLREEQGSIGGPGRELICYACALHIANSVSRDLLGHALLAAREKKPPRRTPVGGVLRSVVFQRDDHACRYCGARTDLTLDHLMPVVRGGENTQENLVVCCGSCNSKKGARTPEEAGMSLRPLEGVRA